MPDPSPTEADDGLPLYLQVTTSLRMAILRGLYPVGSRLPTENTLCERFNVSRHTIREALRQLRADGLINSRPGSRPVVATPSLPVEPERRAGELREDIFDYVISTRLKVEAMDMVTITQALADAYGLPLDERWLCVKGYRTHVDDDHVTCWNEYYINARYAPMGRLLARHVGPILPLLEDLFGAYIVLLRRSVDAIPMPADHGRRFDKDAGSPALDILTRCETADGEIALLYRSLHSQGSVRYSIGR